MPPSAETERDFAIVIGIDNYSDDLRPLNGAVRDAERIWEWLAGPGGVPKDQRWLIRSGRKPDRPVIKQVEDAFAKLRARAEDRENRRLYVYFAGHACSVERWHANLLMADARGNALATGMNAKAYEHWLGKVGWFEQQLFFYDCCRPTDRAVAGREPIYSADETQPWAEEVSQVVHYATRWLGKAHERPTEAELKHRGLFSTALMEGLEGWAAVRTRRGSVITVASLQGYIVHRMRHLVDEYGIDQRPVFRTEANPDLVLFDGIPPLRTDVVVTAPESEPELVIYDDKDIEVVTVALDTGTSTVPLAPRTYSFVAGARERTEVIPKADRFEVDLRDPP
jgi:hypothetical protein